MLVKLNCFRGNDRPGDVVDISDSDGAALIAHGAAFPADDIDAQLAADDARGRTVSGSAPLTATSGTDFDTDTP